MKTTLLQRNGMQANLKFATDKLCTMCVCMELLQNLPADKFESWDGKELVVQMQAPVGCWVQRNPKKAKAMIFGLGTAPAVLGLASFVLMTMGVLSSPIGVIWCVGTAIFVSCGNKILRGNLVWGNLHSSLCNPRSRDSFSVGLLVAFASFFWYQLLSNRHDGKRRKRLCREDFEIFRKDLAVKAPTPVVPLQEQVAQRLEDHDQSVKLLDMLQRFGHCFGCNGRLVDGSFVRTKGSQSCTCAPVFFHKNCGNTQRVLDARCRVCAENPSGASVPIVPAAAHKISDSAEPLKLL